MKIYSQQMVIVLSTGQVSTTQIISLCISILSLSWGASRLIFFLENSFFNYLSSPRSYLILRPKDKSDPDPKLTTVLLHIWPWMFLVTVANLVFLVFIAGVSGPLIFPALAICYGVNLLVLSFFCKVVKPADDLEDGHETSENNKDAVEKETESFIAMAALSSLWLPSVVGRGRIFLVSGITSLVTKVLILAVVVALSDAELLTNIHPKPFLLFCFNDNSPHLNVTDVKPCRFSEHNVSEGDCFLNKNMTHKKLLAKLISDLENLEEYERIVENIDTQLEVESIESGLFQNKYNNTLPDLDEVKRLKEEVKEKLRLSVKLQQKIRICQKDETPFRLFILSGLVVVIALAAYATYRLHRISDYRVFEIKMITSQYLFNLLAGTL